MCFIVALPLQSSHQKINIEKLLKSHWASLSQEVALFQKFVLLDGLPHKEHSGIGKSFFPLFYYVWAMGGGTLSADNEVGGAPIVCRQWRAPPTFLSVSSFRRPRFERYKYNYRRLSVSLGFFRFGMSTSELVRDYVISRHCTCRSSGLCWHPGVVDYVDMHDRSTRTAFSSTQSNSP